jgi:hypothetical protein
VLKPRQCLTEIERVYGRLAPGVKGQPRRPETGRRFSSSSIGSCLALTRRNRRWRRSNAARLILEPGDGVPGPETEKLFLDAAREQVTIRFKMTDSESDEIDGETPIRRSTLSREAALCPGGG